MPESHAGSDGGTGNVATAKRFRVGAPKTFITSTTAMEIYGALTFQLLKT